LKGSTINKIRDIENDISQLPPKKLAEFPHWYEKFDAAQRDKQFEDDAGSGRLDVAATKALKDFKRGRCKAL